MPTMAACLCTQFSYTVWDTQLPLLLFLLLSLLCHAGAPLEAVDVLVDALPSALKDRANDYLELPLHAACGGAGVAVLDGGGPTSMAAATATIGNGTLPLHPGLAQPTNVVGRRCTNVLYDTIHVLK